MIRVAVELDLSLPDNANTHALLASIRQLVSEQGGETLSAWAGSGHVPDDPEEAE